MVIYNLVPKGKVCPRKSKRRLINSVISFALPSGWPSLLFFKQYSCTSKKWFCSWCHDFMIKLPIFVTRSKEGPGLPLSPPFLDLIGVWGRNLKVPLTRIQAQHQHPHRTHRTHDTTDQWREIFGGWGESRRFALLTKGVTEMRPEWRRASGEFLVHFSQEN